MKSRPVEGQPRSGAGEIEAGASGASIITRTGSQTGLADMDKVTGSTKRPRLSPDKQAGDAYVAKVGGSRRVMHVVQVRRGDDDAATELTVLHVSDHAGPRSPDG